MVSFQSILFGSFEGALRCAPLFMENAMKANANGVLHGKANQERVDRMENEDYMRRAITLAEKGRGYTNPNPVVGAVIVKDGRIIGEGYHERCGELHAERNALAACTEDPAGATMFVTLEPCCHYGKTPPCTEAIIEAKIACVYVGSADPNPLVAGKGVAILREAGIEVTEGFLKEACDNLNRVFFHYITTKRPYVTLKYAMTADGKIATATGQSQWITGETARRDVHRLRHENAVIMAAGTSSRFAPLSYERPKGLIMVRGEVLIERQIRQLKETGINDIYVVTGYKHEDFNYLEDKCGVKLLYNKDYNTRNNNASI